MTPLLPTHNINGTLDDFERMRMWNTQKSVSERANFSGNVGFKKITIEINAIEKKKREELLSMRAQTSEPKKSFSNFKAGAKNT